MTEEDFQKLIRNRGLTPAEEHLWRKANGLDYDQKLLPRDKKSLTKLHQLVWAKLQKRETVIYGHEE